MENTINNQVSDPTNGFATIEELEKSSAVHETKEVSNAPEEPKGETIEIFGKVYSVVDDFLGLKTIDELKSYLPSMEGRSFWNLKADIKKNEMYDPILYFKTENGDHLIIDGHTRLSIAMELKLKKVPSKEIITKFESLDDLKIWMMKQQCQRRNLSNLEKLKIAFLSKEAIEKRAKANLTKAGKGEAIENKVDTYKEIAKISGISSTTVRRYNAVLESGNGKVIEAMLKGNISISAAEKKAKEPVKKKAIRETEKKEQQIQRFTSYEEGIKSLNEEKIKALVIVKDEEQIELFNSKQEEEMGFLVAEIQSQEPEAIELTVADYEKLAG